MEDAFTHKETPATSSVRGEKLEAKQKYFLNKRKVSDNALGPHLGNEEMRSLGTADPRALAEEINMHNHRESMMPTLLNTPMVQVIMQAKG